MAALTQDQLDREIKQCANSQQIQLVSEAVRISRLILIAHRVQDFTGRDVVSLASLIMEGAYDDAR